METSVKFFFQGLHQGFLLNLIRHYLSPETTNIISRENVIK